MRLFRFQRVPALLASLGHVAIGPPLGVLCLARSSPSMPHVQRTVLSCGGNGLASLFGCFGIVYQLSLVGPAKSAIRMLDWCTPPPVVAARPVPPAHTAPVTVRHVAGRRVLPFSLGGKCFYAKMKSAWLKMTIIDSRKPELGSWLEEAPSTQVWGVGCRICREAFGERPPSTWASFGVRGKALKTFSIKRHVASRCHKTALTKLLGVHFDSRSSPSLDEFMSVLADRRKGLPHGSTSAVAGRKKACRMTWCLAEAAKDIERAHMKKSMVVALHQDARDQLFLVRYAAVTPDLKVMRGVLGIAKNFGTKSDDICTATIGILENFCTPRISPPVSPTGTQPSAGTVDRNLLEHLRAKIEMFDADAATDEQRAGHVLQGKSESLSIGTRASAILPNLKLIVRDRTHAATRLRPGPTCHLLRADPVLPNIS